MTDVIDRLAGIAEGSSLDRLRRNRPVRRDEIDAGYRALFEPADDVRPSLRDRLAVAAFAADLQDHGSATSKHYRDELAAIDPLLADRIASIAANERAPGPWGVYREPGLQDESRTGDWLVVAADQRSALGEPLAVAIEHAHFLTLHPRDARPEVLKRLVDAGWLRQEIVTWSQLIAYVSFQVRVVEGLRVLQAEGESA